QRSRASSPMCGRSTLARTSTVGWGLPIPLTRSEHQLDRVSSQAEPLPDPFLEVAAVREVQQADVVYEQHHRRSLGASLRRVSKLQPLALEARRGMIHERLAQNLVELVGGHLHPPLADNLERHREHG